MPVTLSKLLGHDSKTEELPAELRAVLSQLRQERAALEGATARAHQSAEQLGQLGQPLAEAQRTVVELQSRVKALERLVPVLATLDEQTETVARVQRRTETQIEHVSEDAKRLRAELDGLRGGLESALALKHELTGFLELGGGFKALRLDADGLAGQLEGVTQGLDRARERQEELRRTTETVASRLAVFEQRQQQAQTGVAATESRLAALEGALANCSAVVDDVAQTKRQLATLKALADHVSQKGAMLEQQRAAVERALEQTTHLQDVTRDIDGKIRQQQESAGRLSELEARVQGLRVEHDGLLERTAQIGAQHQEIRQADQELRGRLTALRDDLQRNVKRFELENEGLDAVGQRIVDLRGGLTDLESRFGGLDDASRTITEVGARAGALGAQLDGMVDSVGQLQVQADRVGAVQVTASRLSHAVEEMTGRVSRLEKAQPTVEAVLRDFASLQGTHEAVQEAMDQLRGAEGDIARMRQGQTETKAWLATVTTSVDALRGEFAALEEVHPKVAAVRSQADQVSQTLGQIESRREFLEALNRRLFDLATLGTELEERSRGLVARVEAADAQFKSLAAHADEAARVEAVVPSVLAAVDRAERRVGEVDRTVASLEERCQSVVGLADRTQALGEELERRQSALDKATEHLERASSLREEAATVAQQLEDRATQLTGTVTTAGAHVAEIAGTLDELDNRAENLRFVQKRMAQFEERLAKWQSAELQLSRALEQFTHRQATLDAMRVEMQRLFDVAERTVEEVRSIGAARDEVNQTRSLLENVLALVGHAHEAANGLDHRKRQVELAEERLGRVEALLTDVQSSLELLHGQKAFLSQVVEKAGQLEFHSRQAEALIETLREERSIADRVHTAVEQSRQEVGLQQSA